VYGAVEIQSERLGIWLTLKPGDSVTLEPGVAHRFRAATTVARVVEASTMHNDDDVVRLEPSKLL
jgi:D-lyxose ketol-isomerase